MTGMPHWDLSPLLYYMGHWREGRVLGRPPANRSAHGELTQVTSIGLPILPPAPPLLWTPYPRFLHWRAEVAGYILLRGKRMHT